MGHEEEHGNDGSIAPDPDNDGDRYALPPGNISGTAAIVLGVVAVILVVSSAVGFCPSYLPLRISTRKKSTQGPCVTERPVLG